jgi:hypothetical protein
MEKSWLLLLCLVPLLVAPLLATGGNEEEESVLGCGGFIQSARLQVSSRNCLLANKHCAIREIFLKKPPVGTLLMLYKTLREKNLYSNVPRIFVHFALVSFEKYFQNFLFLFLLD